MHLENEIKKIVESCGAKLYDIETLTERGKTIYRVTITAPKGVDLEQCATISNLISPLLDVHPPIEGEYHLEVSSPGIERKLKKPNHFQNSTGEQVRIQTVDGESIQGTLVHADESKIQVDTEAGKRTIGYDEIAGAKTYFEW
ncbi:MAG: ribosome maturation factor RimP [Nitratiruptor sp.]|nr:ribosome maturation factor RimP [Nitratiruptor sp.]NPA82868.1 ribosome maturation factor RimP [Campylobacterota bacterium]